MKGIWPFVLKKTGTGGVKMRKLILLFIMSFLFYPFAGIAQEKKKGFELKEIIVTATRHKTPVEQVPASVTIIIPKPLYKSIYNV